MSYRGKKGVGGCIPLLSWSKITLRTLRSDRALCWIQCNPCFSLQPLVNDISLVWSALSLPVLEPLTSAKMEKLSTITMSCLYAAVSIATANSILGISSAISPKTAVSNNTTGLSLSTTHQNNYSHLPLIWLLPLTIEIHSLSKVLHLL